MGTPGMPSTPAPRPQELTITTWRWIDTVTTQLELSDATPEDLAVVLSADTTDPELRDAALHALERVGCAVAMLTPGTQGAASDPLDNPVVLAGLRAADLVVDVADLVGRSSHRNELLLHTRVLAITVDRAADLDRLVAHPGLPRRVEHLDHILEEAEELRLVTAELESLDIDLDGSRRRLDRGIADRAGELARWPAGAVWVRPNTTGVHGVLVLLPGDIVIEARHLVRSPVRLEIEGGHLVEIIGESTDADVLRSHLEADPHPDDAYQVCEVGFGLNLLRSADPVSPFDPGKFAVGQGAAAAGRCSVRFGLATAPSATVTMMTASALLDDRAILETGHLSGAVAPDVYERAAAR